MASVDKKLALKPEKKKIKRCSLCGVHHYGAGKVCQKCKEKKC